MPPSSDILAGLESTASVGFPFAVAWHVVLAAAFLAFARRRPGVRTVLVLSGALAASVAVASFAARNPFNTLSFAALTALLVGGAFGARREAAEVATAPVRFAGIATVLFGFVYPHFLDGRPLWAGVYAAPIGIVPCPTLSIIVGLALWFGSYGSRALTLVLAAFGAYYGFVGAFRLGVSIDLVLLAASLVLAVSAVPHVGRRPSQPRPA